MNRRLLIVGVIVLFGGVFAESQLPVVPNPAPADGSAQPSSERLYTRKDGVSERLYTRKDGVKPPKLLYSRDPEYPKEARKSKKEGIVVLWVVIGSDGFPSEVSIARSIDPNLDKAAMDAVRSWKFVPAKKDRKPVATMVNVEVSFRLR
jgi:TonB family protein